MKFTRTQLIEVIDAAISRDDEAQAARDRAAEEWPKWKAYRDQLSKLIRRGNPITAEDLEGLKQGSTYNDDVESYGRLNKAVTKVRRDHPVLGLDRRAEFTALKSTLEAVLDDEVTDSQLGRLGFGASSISRVFRAATVEAGK